MRFNRSFYAPHAPEGDGDGGGAAGAPPAAAPAAAATPAAPAAPAAAPAAATPAAPPASALASGATPPPPAAAAPAAPPAAPDPVWGTIPEKYRTKNEAGEPDLSASWSKVEEARANLERRLGAGEVPPKAAGDYKLNFPEALADKFKADEMAASPKFQAWRDEMHKAGLSQKQFDQAFGSMLSLGLSQQQGAQSLDQAGCVAELSKTWGDPAERQQNLNAAFRAASTFGDVDKLMEKYGNDPDFIRVMAKVGAELREDTSSTGIAAPAGEGMKQEHEALSKWLHQMPNTDPEWAAKNARYNQLSEKIWGTGAKGHGSMSIGMI